MTDQATHLTIRPRSGPTRPDGPSDATWRLTTQIYSGQAQASDRGACALVDLTVEHGPVTTVITGAAFSPNALNKTNRFAARNTAVSINPLLQPLEAHIEAEPVGTDLTARISHGARLTALVRANNAPVPEAFCFSDDDLADLHPDDTAARQRLEPLLGHCLDPARITQDPNPASLPGITEDAFAEWRSSWGHHDGHLATPSVGEYRCWSDEDQSYHFALPVKIRSDTETEAILSASQHRSGNIDWTCFDIEDHHQPSADAPAAIELTAHQQRVLLTVPSPIPSLLADEPSHDQRSGRTSPASAGGLVGTLAASDDHRHSLQPRYLALSRRFAAETWGIAPVEVPLGSLARLTGVAVHDGYSSPYTNGDTGRDLTVDEPKPFFALDPIQAKEDDLPSGVPLLYVPAFAGLRQQQLLEAVDITQDHAGNTAWATEAHLQGATGPITLTEPTPTEPAEDDSTVEPALWSFELLPSPPQHQYRLRPSAPVTGGPATDIVLDPDSQPQTDILTASPTFSMFRELLGPAALRLARSWEVARSPNGHPLTWISRSSRTRLDHDDDTVATDVVTRPATRLGADQ